MKDGLVKENDDLLNNASRDITSNSKNLANFFYLSNRARTNGQTDLHKKWINRFVNIYS